MDLEGSKLRLRGQAPSEDAKNKVWDQIKAVDPTYADLSAEITVVPGAGGASYTVQKGDTLYLTDAPDGGLRITPYNPDFQRQMALAEQIMHDDREILRVLAK